MKEIGDDNGGGGRKNRWWYTMADEIDEWWMKWTNMAFYQNFCLKAVFIYIHNKNILSQINIWVYRSYR